MKLIKIMKKISKYDDGFVVEQDEPVQKIDDIITKIENETKNKEIKQIKHEPDGMKL